MEYDNQYDIAESKSVYDPGDKHMMANQLICVLS